MRFGAAKDIITPCEPMKIACTGIFDKDFEEIHDDVFVRCLVMDDGNEKTVLMSFDLLFHDHALNDSVAEYASEKYGIKADGVMISYTHAHTAPASFGYNPQHHNDEFERMLLSRAKSCLDRAMCSMFEGTVEYGIFDADFNISRRGVLNGEYANYPNFDYEHDREFYVICVRDLCGNVRSVVTNYACHPVFYPAYFSISAEFPGRLCQLLDTNYYGSVALFFQSAGGDVRPRPTVSGNEDGTYSWARLPFSEIDKFAKEISKTVISFVDAQKCKKIDLSVKADEFSVELKMKPKTLEEFHKLMEDCEKQQDNPNKVNAYNITHGGYEKLSDSLALRCRTIRIADSFYIATVGGEPCFGVKKAVKAAFGESDVCFIGYTDSCAYVVDDKVLDEGGYEATCHLEYGLIGPFEKGLNKLYTDGFAKSLERISG